MRNLLGLGSVGLTTCSGPVWWSLTSTIKLIVDSGYSLVWAVFLAIFAIDATKLVPSERNLEISKCLKVKTVWTEDGDVDKEFYLKGKDAVGEPKVVPRGMFYKF